MQVKPLSAEALRDPALPGRLATLLTTLAALAWTMQVTEFDPRALFDPTGLRAAGHFLIDFVPPAHGGEFLRVVFRATWTTVAIATAGVALALLLAIPAALLLTDALSLSGLGRQGRQAPAARLARRAMRSVLVVLRSVPELIWALLLVRVVGLGAGAGVLAIAITYLGMLGKVYAEILESAPHDAMLALVRNGAGRLQAAAFGLLPACRDELLSYTVYRWECAVRSSVVLGFVGAGGLGQEIDLSMKAFAGNEVCTLLLVFVALVALADLASRLLRWRDAPAAAGPLTMMVFGGLVIASFASLDLQWAAFRAPESLGAMRRFAAELMHPELQAAFLRTIAHAALETLAMSALATALAAALALLLFPLGAPLLILFNLLRAVPELVWASLLLIALGLGPFAGTLALTLHTTGVLGRLYRASFQNLPPDAAFALRCAGASRVQIFLFAQLPAALPQLISYGIYRWENNIRAAAVLGVVGAGGLGQMLAFHLGLFQMGRTATVVAATLLLIVLVDTLSQQLRRRLG